MNNWIVTPRITEQSGQKSYSVEVNVPDSQPGACVTFGCKDENAQVALELALRDCTNITWIGDHG
jgi:hypothetical protein